MKKDLEECRQALLDSFPKSWFNERDEFIADTRSNTYLIFNNCESVLDLECKILEWLSRPASYATPYSQDWRNKKFHERMLNGINAFLGTDFDIETMGKIYCELGNAIHHNLTIRFVESGYDMNVLKDAGGE